MWVGFFFFKPKTAYEVWCGLVGSEMCLGDGAKAARRDVEGKITAYKRRLILDAKESGVTQFGRKNERIMLPNVINFVFDTLDLDAACQSH